MSFQEFYLERNIDDSGVSGTGLVAHGIILRNGWCVLEWLTKYTSIGVYPSIQELEKIHGHGTHTKIVYKNADPRTAE